MSRAWSTAIWRDDGREDEADGVGAHGHGEETVLLGGDPADLHEHPLAKRTERPLGCGGGFVRSRSWTGASPW